MHISPDIKRNAMAEIRSPAWAAGGAAGAGAWFQGVECASPVFAKLKTRRTCRQVWQLFVNRALQ